MAFIGLNMDQLKRNFVQSGRLEWIGLRPARGLPMKQVMQANAIAGSGLEGDRTAGYSGSKRQVTLIQSEYLAVVQSFLPAVDVTPANLRRNLVISGINLNALVKQIIVVGGVQLEITGLCHPCKKLEERLGHGVFNALRGHGGLTARILSSGPIRVGDALEIGLQEISVEPQQSAQAKLL